MRVSESAETKYPEAEIRWANEYKYKSCIKHKPQGQPSAPLRPVCIHKFTLGQLKQVLLHVGQARSQSAEWLG